MRYLILISLSAALLTLSACSESGGEDDFFFDRTPVLTRFVIDNCNLTPEDELPFALSNSNFGADMLSETLDAEDSTFTDNCLGDDPDADTMMR